MKYKPPRDIQTDSPYYVNIVAKNKEYLLGYIHGSSNTQRIIEDVLPMVRELLR